ncbi:MAG: hypothetical protein CL912_32095 [Deltaproteobacteria bacterium]|nr:hypothetical protein [Deltaproteobacteria bacterium]
MHTRFPSRLLISTDKCDPADKDRVSPPKQTAIELWALYSYNLHKATYNGLNNLASRANKRNFIIGRGSFAGMHRYAGLWTGDNASTWSFWQVCISQIINLGYSGMSIAGVDMGGFLQDGSNQFCDPDLLIRWYSGAFMLPWYRYKLRSLDAINSTNKSIKKPLYCKIAWSEVVPSK